MDPLLFSLHQVMLSFGSAPVSNCARGNSSKLPDYLPEEDDDDASEPQPDNSKSRPKIKLLFKPKKGTKGQLNNNNNNNNNIFISYIKYTNITPPANSKANRGRWCVQTA